MGEEAAAGELLVDMIDNDRAGAEVEDIALEPTLVVRRSTARPAS